MALIREIAIRNFRSIKKLNWQPQVGINCLIGCGDSGKSTILDAIDFTLGARRQAAFTDADFHNLDVDVPIEICVTLGDLSDDLNNIETYGLFHRGRNTANGEVHPEPALGLETVLAVSLSVGSDLQPVWSLVSSRAAERGHARDLVWSHRAAHAPSRLGPFAALHFSWGPRSILNRLTKDETNAAGALAHAARSARAAFTDRSDLQVERTLAEVMATAMDLGVPMMEAHALLDIQAQTFSGGSIAVHDESKVPLRNLGLGSARLLVAGMQHRAAHTQVALIDELEHGLEPYRIVRLLHKLGAKDTVVSGQIFMTTHSPVVLRELKASQLFIVRPAKLIPRADANPPGELEGDNNSPSHAVITPGAEDSVQAALRACAEGFLSPAVLMCEGKTEMGLVRGMDLYLVETGHASMGAIVIYPADGGGSNTFRRALVFAQNGYRTAILRDDDVEPAAADIRNAATAGISIFKWTDGQALEEQIFAGVPDDCIELLLNIAVERCGMQAIDDHIRNHSENAFGLNECIRDFSDDKRPILGRAAKSKSWFKDIEPAEQIGRDIIGPNLGRCNESLRHTLRQLRDWVGFVDGSIGPRA